MRGRVLALLVVLLFLAGCAPPPEKRKRFFWPMLSQDPKIEFIDFYMTDYDVEEGAESAFQEAVAGRRKPRRIFARPFDVAADDDRNIVYVVDHGQNRVRVLDLDKHEIRELLDKKGQIHYFRIPAGAAVGPDGGVFVSDAAGGSVTYFDRAGIKRREISSERLDRPTGLSYDPQRDRLYVVDSGRHRVLVFDGEGGFLHAFGERGRGPGQFNFPNDVAVGPEGQVVVLDAMNARVQVFSPEGKVLRVFGERGTALGSFSLPKGVAVDGAGHVYVTDARLNKVVIFDLQGRYLLTIGEKHIAVEEGGFSPGGFYMPQGIGADSGGGIWICDSFNKVVYKFQYLNEKYLRDHPIAPVDVYVEPEERPSRDGD